MKLTTIVMLTFMMYSCDYQKVRVDVEKTKLHTPISNYVNINNGLIKDYIYSNKNNTNFIDNLNSIGISIRNTELSTKILDYLFKTYY